VNKKKKLAITIIRFRLSYIVQRKNSAIFVFGHFVAAWRGNGSVERDDDFILNTIIPRVKEFFYTNMLPEIQKKMFPMF